MARENAEAAEGQNSEEVSPRAPFEVTVYPGEMLRTYLSIKRVLGFDLMHSATQPGCLPSLRLCPDRTPKGRSFHHFLAACTSPPRKERKLSPQAARIQGSFLRGRLSRSRFALRTFPLFNLGRNGLTSQSRVESQSNLQGGDHCLSCARFFRLLLGGSFPFTTARFCALGR